MSLQPAAKNQMLAQLVWAGVRDRARHGRKRLVEHLMKPLGILSLAAVANGIFVKIRFKGGWSDGLARMDDAQGVQVGDVIDLASFAQQVSTPKPLAAWRRCWRRRRCWPVQLLPRVTDQDCAAAWLNAFNNANGAPGGLLADFQHFP
ncbi:MAG: hypothetical protein IPI20_07415 [Rhodoferax sp.]|nr:hypothetical protein [Rhodoferax sp.]